MKRIVLVLIFVATATLAHGEDIVSLISQYRREHGLSAVKVDARLTAVAEHQAHAMATTGVMDHDVAGSFASRIANAGTDSSAENIAAGTKTWEETLRIWKESSGHNANLLRAGADSIGVAVAHNEQTRYKHFWAMVIGHKETAHHLRAVAAGPGAADEPVVRVKRTKSQEPGFLDSLGSLWKGATSPFR
jgi:hypothetical protein